MIELSPYFSSPAHRLGVTEPVRGETLDKVRYACYFSIDIVKEFSRMDLREIEKAAKEQGWQVGRTKKGHLRYVPPDPTREIVIGSGTPSDWRAMKNFLAELKRQGFIWPWPPEGK